MPEVPPNPPPLPSEKAAGSGEPPPFPDEYRIEKEVERRASWKVAAAILLFFFVRRAFNDSDPHDARTRGTQWRSQDGNKSRQQAIEFLKKRDAEDDHRQAK